MLQSKDDLLIPVLGPAMIESPVPALLGKIECRIDLLGNGEKIIFNPHVSSLAGYLKDKASIPALELAGPRCQIYFDPAKTAAAIATCGGLCPGINDVIRGIVMTLFYRYGVNTIWGAKYGYQGLVERFGHSLVKLEPEGVANIHRDGGSMLSCSRGEQDPREVVDFLVKNQIQILFVIGGDGTLRGAMALGQEIRQRDLKISVIGIPKTVDNDILHIDESFGFQTAFSEAERAILSAHAESWGAPNGIGLVKLMGRHSGFIACYSALAMNDVNYVLIPEVPFVLDGDTGFLKVLHERLLKKRHAVIVAAEGAGQDLIEGNTGERDASGNVKFKDIGLYLKNRINAYFKSVGLEVNLKYIDPGYMIRSVPASPQDSVYCLRLAEAAVHAAMSGRTEMVVGRRLGYYVHFPIKLLAMGRKQVDPAGDLWLSVLEATGQPVSFLRPPVALGKS